VCVCDFVCMCVWCLYFVSVCGVVCVVFKSILLMRDLCLCIVVVTVSVMCVCHVFVWRVCDECFSVCVSSVCDFYVCFCVCVCVVCVSVCRVYVFYVCACVRL